MFKNIRRDLMNFVDFIILTIVLGILGLIIYFNFIKRDEDACLRCPYKSKNRI